ncbi:MAG: hypothetical protein UR91_C0007G0017 [Candidatus Nomurabacteria bacterium GW2011_GWC2_35_8]|uniref:Uncharacterized protein n=1 Tax=Candidatus Nomurabacteria bacterium GW2011_GWC2_35_8 TaxID=1618752 RepID=A0A0G0GBF8_9BACT|nr:MAG: hypothetical protein UR91_C0007G0017 [Candidatus Nomurabacteria bacterium GW2011_GWC2_35_8]
MDPVRNKLSGIIVKLLNNKFLTGWIKKQRKKNI